MSGNFKAKDYHSNIHSPRMSQHSNNDTALGFKRISQEQVESISKALTPNYRVRQNSPKPIIEEKNQNQIQKHNFIFDNFRQVMHQEENNQETKKQPYIGYINFTKFARKILYLPIKEIKIIKTKNQMTRQRSIDFNSKQDEWLKQKNEKVLKKRIEMVCQKQQKENQINQINKSKTFK